MMVSVIICTWNRARLLDATLSSLARLNVPDAVTWELLVVDNASTDDTPTVIEKHRSKLPLVALHEPRQGHTRARNTGIRQARGDLILWTDDDVVVDANWLVEYVRVANVWPHAGFFGGRITPLYEVPPPRWVKDNLELLQGLLVIRDLPQPEGVSAELFFGANMAFRADLQKQNLFDESLGVQGRTRIIGDETALMASLRERGIVGVWVPSATLQHVAPKDRLTLRFAWRYFTGLGRTGARVENLRVSRGYLFKLMLRDAYYLCSRVLRGHRLWFDAFRSLALHWGQYREIRQRR